MPIGIFRRFPAFFLIMAIASRAHAVPAANLGNPGILSDPECCILFRPTSDSLPNIIPQKENLIWPHRRITVEQFNNGVIHQPIQLVQGLLPGLLIARAGANHHESFTSRYRGISTFYGNPDPLIVIDGVPAAFLESLDPGDLETLSIIADPVGQSALYGARAAAGVILLESRKQENDSARVVYSGSFAIEAPLFRLNPLDAGEFRKFAGATDLGTATDWPAEVAKNGRAHIHRLAFSGQAGQGAYRVSLNLRDVEGIAHNDRFRQLNGRLYMDQKFFKEKIQLGIHLFSTAREGSPGDPNTFRYAVSTNPTMPVLDPSATAFGGFAERDIFDAFNPVAIYAQNIRKDRVKVLGGTLRSQITLAKNLHADVLWSGQKLERATGRYAFKSARYGGGFYRNGLADLTGAQNTSNTFMAGMEFQQNTGRVNMVFTSNFFRQQFRFASSEIQAGDFLTDAFSFHNLGAALDIANGKAQVASYKSLQALSAFALKSELKIWEIWGFSAAARFEGASQSGKDARWAFYPAFSSTLALAPLLGEDETARLNLRTGFSITGNLPRQTHLSQGRYGPSTPFFFNGNYSPSYTLLTNPNPGLSAERTTTFDLALDFALFRNRIAGYLTYYRRNTDRLILPTTVAVPPNPAPVTWQNTAGLTNSGIEAALDLAIAVKRNFSWKSTLNFSTFNTIAVKVPDPPFSGLPYIYSAAIGGPGQGESQAVAPIIRGERLGLLWGPLRAGIQPNGSPAFKDLNGDGRYCFCNDDHTIIGNGLPRFAAGLQNTLSIGKVQLSVRLRAVLGHDMLNTFRLFYENTAPYTLSNYNIVKTKYFDPALKLPGLSDFFIENAGFLEIDNVHLSYRLPTQKKQYFREVSLFITAQKPAFLSAYTGISPEPRFPGNDLLAPGIERRDTFWPARTFSMGIIAGMN
jgi:hypothetical protein